MCFSICRIEWTSNALISPTGATIVEGDQSKFYSCGKIVLGSNRTQFMYHASRWKQCKYIFTSTSRFQREVQFVCDSHFMQLATYYMRQTFVSTQHNWLYDEFSTVCMLIFSFGVSRRVVVNLEVVVWYLTQDYSLIRHNCFRKWHYS